MRRAYAIAYRHPSGFGGMGVAADTFIPWLKDVVPAVEEVVLTAPGRPLARVGKLGWESVYHSLRLLGDALRRCLVARPMVCYFAIAQSGPALVRDVAILGVYRAACVPCVIHLHGSLLPQTLKRRVGGSMLRAALPRATWLVLHADLAEMFPQEWTAVPVLNPRPNRVCRRVERHPGQPLRVGWLGLIRREKGVDLLIAACRRVSEVRLTLAGEWGNVPRDAAGDRYIGELSHENALAYWTRQDVFVLPSRLQEGLPLVVLEALEAGVLVAATTSPALRDMIGAGAVTAVEANVASISRLLESVRSPLALEAAVAKQQDAWSSLRDDYAPDRVRCDFQQAVRGTLRGRE